MTTWLEFRTEVDDLLTVDRKRLDAQQFIDKQVRLAVGDIQRLIPYYRKGMLTEYGIADATSDGDASIITLPEGMNLREVYYAKAGSVKIRRPIREYEFSNRYDLVAGVVEIGSIGQWFRYAIDQRDGAKTMWIYPALIEGWEVELHWDALLGRTGSAYTDSTEVPFDEPMQLLVAEFVKAKLAREVDRDLRLAEDYMKSYQKGISSLYSEVEERMRQKVSGSRAVGDYDECDEDDDDEEEESMVALWKEFETVAIMLAEPSQNYRIAKCWNYEAGDNVDTVWVRTEKPGLVDDGANVRQTDDGAWVERIYGNLKL